MSQLSAYLPSSVRVRTCLATPLDTKNREGVRLKVYNDLFTFIHTELNECPYYTTQRRHRKGKQLQAR